jgi:hypothetical protein
MTLIESTPQTRKHYDERTQDHGDASQKGQHEYDVIYRDKSRRAVEKSDDLYFTDAVNEVFATQSPDYLTMSPDELEAEASELLGDTGMYTVGESEYDGTDVFDEPTPYQDRFPTEAEYGVKSRKEIANKLARLATLDPDYDDDNGDDDYASPIRIRNKL